MTRTGPTIDGGRGERTESTAPASRLPRLTKRTVTRGLAAATGAMFIFSGVAAAGTPPLGPGNIEIFAARDMVALEGYSAQAGETATVTVKRNGQQIGIGSGVIDPTGFLEFNHPGGECWQNVTPDIQSGDLVEVRFDKTAFTDGAVTSSAKIISVKGDPVAKSVTIDGTYVPADFDADGPFSFDRFVVEVVNPEMRRPDPSTPPTAIGERAIGWTPVVDPAEPNGGPGYTVEGTAANGTFSVKFVTQLDADYERVLDGEHVVTSWMADAGELALGNSLFEFGETNGPGFGGCPAGPASQPPVPPASATVTRAGGDITLKWTAPAQPADANKITQYRVAAFDGVLGQEIAIRQGASDGENSATIKGLNPEQSYRLILEANNGQWSPVVELGTVDTAGTVTPPVDETNPTPPPGTGTGTTPPGGGTTPPGGGTTPPGAVAPTAATLTRVIAGHESVTAEWTAAQPGNTDPASAITGYQIVATPTAAGGAPVTSPVIPGTSGTLSGLANNTEYTVSVLALAGPAATPVSTPSTVATGVVATVKPNDVVTVSRAQYRADKREYKISGTAADTTLNRVHIRTSTGVTIQLNVAVAADGTWSVDLRNGPLLPTDNRINVTSDSGANLTTAVTRSR